MSDIYDAEIERLVAIADITRPWCFGEGHSCLFDSCNAERFAPDESSCGCLTQVRLGLWSAATPELTNEIAADESLPMCMHSFQRQAWQAMDEAQRREALQPFARWQRRLDTEIPNREPPKAPGGTP